MVGLLIPYVVFVGIPAAETYIPPVASDSQRETISSTGKAPPHGTLVILKKFRVSRLHVLLGGRVWTSPFLDLRHSIPELEAAVFKK